MRATSKKWHSEPPIVGGLRKLFISRTLRLVRDVVELEREVLDSDLLHGSRISVPQEETDEARDRLSGEGLQRKFNLAQKARLNVLRDNLTEEFHRAFEGCRSSEPFETWKEYKKNCGNRQAWGQYFRSNLDWEWDVARSLKRLYKRPRKRPGPSPRPARLNSPHFPVMYAHPEPVAMPISSTSKLRDGLLHVEAAADGPVEEVRVQVAVRSSSGEISYKMFIAAPASDLCPSTRPFAISTPPTPDTDDHQETTAVRGC